MKIICIPYHFSTLTWRGQLQTFVIEDKDLLTKHRWYYGCWYFCEIWNQTIWVCICIFAASPTWFGGANGSQYRRGKILSAKLTSAFGVTLDLRGNFGQQAPLQQWLTLNSCYMHYKVQHINDNCRQSVADSKGFGFYLTFIIASLTRQG